jgi:hypothetical protein
MCSDFFHGQIGKGLFYWPNHSGETRLSKQEKEEEEREKMKESKKRMGEKKF